jgi:protein ImuA
MAGMTRWTGRERLESLRAAVARIERGVAAARGDGVLPLGVAAIDAVLEEGGLRTGALHEVAGPAADGFAAALAGRLAARDGGTVLWCTAGQGRGALHPPGLAMLGLAPAWLLLVRCRNRVELLAAAEEGLRSAGLAAVVMEAARPPGMTAARRLQLAAETGGVTGILLCRGASRRHGANAPGAMAPDSRVDRHRPAPPPGRPTVSYGVYRAERAVAGSTIVEHTPDFLPPSPAVSRWQVDPAPGGRGMRWRLSLLRCRGGGAGRWKVDWDEKTHRFAVVPPAGD